VSHQPAVTEEAWKGGEGALACERWEKKIGYRQKGDADSKNTERREHGRKQGKKGRIHAIKILRKKKAGERTKSKGGGWSNDRFPRNNRVAGQSKAYFRAKQGATGNCSFGKKSFDR